MQTIYRADLKAHVSVDERELVRHIRHSDEYWASEHTSPLATASAYLDAMADTLGIDKAELGGLDKRVSFLDPLDQGTEYQLSEEKPLFESTLISYAQTHLNVPVWRRGLTVRVKLNPTRVVGMTNNSEGELRAKLPPAQTVERYRAIFRQTLARRAAVAAGLDEDEAGGVDEAVSFLRAAVKADPPGPASRRTRAAKTGETRLLSGKFVVYRYVESRRYGGKRSPTTDQTVEETAEEAHDTPYPTLPAVPATVKDGQAYLAAELIFTSDDRGFGGLAWLALVELRSGAVLYLECMTCGLNGQVFRRDPIVKTGDLTITADDAVATLNMQRDAEPLTNLDAAVAGTQSLSGTYVKIAALTPMHADPDTVLADEAEQHRLQLRLADKRLRRRQRVLPPDRAVQDDRRPRLPNPRPTSTGRLFPIPIDHRALGDAINAHWSPNGSDGTAHMCFALCDLTNTAQPLLRAVDPWVHWHEMGGHGTLGDHVGSGNLGFSHSAGDGLAAVQIDPESKLREAAKPERFRYAPFRPFVLAPVVGDPTPPERRFDRGVAAWAWGGSVVTDASGNVLSGDDGGYGSEQILATCHFESTARSAATHDSRAAALRLADDHLADPGDDPEPDLGHQPEQLQPDDDDDGARPRRATLVEALQVTDGTNWTSEGHGRRGYKKVIRWAFEKQGCYQPAGTPAPFTTAGAPPSVDVYIDDGRGGEYPFQSRPLAEHVDLEPDRARRTGSGTRTLTTA